MRNKSVQHKYTPLDKVFMLDIDGKLDRETMKQVNLLTQSAVYAGY